MRQYFVIPLLPAILFIALFSFWSASSTPAKIGETLSQNWHAFLEESRKNASDHNKLADCLTDGEKGTSE